MMGSEKLCQSRRDPGRADRGADGSCGDRDQCAPVGCQLACGGECFCAGWGPESTDQRSDWFAGGGQK